MQCLLMLWSLKNCVQVAFNDVHFFVGNRNNRQTRLCILYNMIWNNFIKFINKKATCTVVSRLLLCIPFTTNNAKWQKEKNRYRKYSFTLIVTITESSGRKWLMTYVIIIFLMSARDFVRVVNKSDSNFY